MNLRKDHYRIWPRIQLKNCEITRLFCRHERTNIFSVLCLSEERRKFFSETTNQGVKNPAKELHYAMSGEGRLAELFAKLEPKRTHISTPTNSESELKRRRAHASCAARAFSTFNVVKLSATDVLAPTTMKNAAKCDTSCDLQNPVNHQNFERILRFRDMPGSMLVGVSVDTTRHQNKSS